MRIGLLTLLGAILALSVATGGSGSPGNPNEPDVSFTWVQNGLQVAFTDHTTLELYNIQWYWDFGDGQHSDVQNPIHTFPGYGNYTVSLRVWNSLGFSGINDETVWVEQGVQQQTTYGTLFWISLFVLFAGAVVIIFGRFSYVRVGGALVLLVGLMLLLSNPPQVGLADSLHTDNSYIAYVIPLVLLMALGALMAVSKNPYLRIALVVAFVTSLVVLMVV